MCASVTLHSGTHTTWGTPSDCAERRCAACSYLHLADLLCIIWADDGHQRGPVCVCLFACAAVATTSSTRRKLCQLGRAAVQESVGAHRQQHQLPLLAGWPPCQLLTCQRVLGEEGLRSVQVRSRVVECHTVGVVERTPAEGGIRPRPAAEGSLLLLHWEGGRRPLGHHLLADRAPHCCCEAVVAAATCWVTVLLREQLWA